MKALRHIALFLLASFSAILVHNLVPHHHHMEAHSQLEAHACTAEHDHEDEDSQDEDHGCCHAFNDLHFFKDAASLIPQPTNMPIDLACSSQVIVAFIDYTTKEAPPVPPKVPLEKGKSIGLHCLRAPPHVM